MKKEQNSIIENEEGSFDDAPPHVPEKKSQEDTNKSCEIKLSLQEFGYLARRALDAGCSPEELVARRVSELLSPTEK